jgi:uracil-DNA glycosylase family protein
MDEHDDESPKSARAFLPKARTIDALRKAARECQGCALYRNATQTVFGEGNAHARILLVGEQPGNDEDLSGHPFVGPAGRVLDEGLAAVGLDRAETYITNVVKHFKWEPRGKRRMHSKPSMREIDACFPWLEQEIALLRPDLIVCLGATAARALLGSAFRVTRQRGQPVESPLAPHVIATIHPSSILRQPTAEGREREMAAFIADLKAAAGLVGRRT